MGNLVNKKQERQFGRVHAEPTGAWCVPDKTFGGIGAFAPALRAWHARQDYSARDPLWRAACWDRAGLERAGREWDRHPANPDERGARADFARALEIVMSDPVATAAVMKKTGWPAPGSSQQAQQASGASAAASPGWPRAKRAAWG